MREPQVSMVAPSAPRDARSKTPPGPEGSNGIDRRGCRGQPAGSSPVSGFAKKTAHDLLSQTAGPAMYFRSARLRRAPYQGADLRTDHRGASDPRLLRGNDDQAKVIGPFSRLRMQPTGIAFGIALMFPDRHARLHFIDDVTAGGEGCIAMGRSYADPHREFADGEVAGAMDAARIDDGEFFRRLHHDPFALAFGQCGVSLVAQAEDHAVGIVVADPALEAGETADTVIQQVRAQRRGVEGGIAEREALHGIALVPGCGVLRGTGRLVRLAAALIRRSREE